MIDEQTRDDRRETDYLPHSLLPLRWVVLGISSMGCCFLLAKKEVAGIAG
jgi:hypothetical protein